MDDPDIYPNPHIIFKSGGGYSSPLGCKKYTANPITFGWNMKWGKIAHEVMHTLGKDQLLIHGIVPPALISVMDGPQFFAQDSSTSTPAWTVTST